MSVVAIRTALNRASGAFGRNTHGVALLEFAFGAPILLTVGLYGIELSNLALSSLRITYRPIFGLAAQTRLRIRH
jgi:Flp pilus assembly protein TadG